MKVESTKLTAGILGKPTQTPHQTYSTPATSPPTPSQQSDPMRTRSGKAIRTSQTPGGSRSYRAEPYDNPSPKTKPAGPAAKKKKKSPKEDDKEFEMTTPLSILCEDMNIEEIDIVAYANRSVEVRQKEVESSKNGKTKRPSNAFMLYRKAFQNRAKQLKKHDNHQIVSKVCGSSWKNEQEHIKIQFNDLARRESELHKAAFPDYKFAPARPTKGKDKRPTPGLGAAPGRHPDDGRSFDGEESDLNLTELPPPSRPMSGGPIYDDHPDAEYLPPGATHGAGYPDPYGHYTSPMMSQQSHPTPTFQHRTPPPPHHIASYEYSNPGRPPPHARPYDTGTLSAQQPPQMYHHQYPSPQQQHQQYPGGMIGPGGMPYGMIPRVENVYVHRTESPGSAGGAGPAYGVGNSPVMGPPPPINGDRFGGMVVPGMYGNLGMPPQQHPHSHQYSHPHQLSHHGMPLPPQQHRPPHPQLARHQPQNIDPSLMPLHPPPPPPAPPPPPHQHPHQQQQHPDEVGDPATSDLFNGDYSAGEFHAGVGDYPLGDGLDQIYHPTASAGGTPPYYGGSDSGIPPVPDNEDPWEIENLGKIDHLENDNDFGFTNLLDDPPHHEPDHQVPQEPGRTTPDEQHQGASDAAAGSDSGVNGTADGLA